MQRRSFLKLLAGTAVATQIPSVLLSAEEKTGEYSVRYVKAYDVYSDRMIERVDVARGFNLPIPKAIDTAQCVHNVSREYVGRAIATMKRANVPPEAVALLESELYRLKPESIIGVDFSR